MFEAAPLTQEEFEHLFSLFDAYWEYDGEPRAERPHALLASGLHSNGFFDCGRVLSHSNLCQIMAQAMVRTLRFMREGSTIFSPGVLPRPWVVGTATSSTDLSKDVANLLSAFHVPLDKRDKTQVWPDRYVVGEDQLVYDFEELMTTSEGVQALRTGIRAKHGYPIHFREVVVLVHRSSVREIEDTPVIPVFHYDIQNWDPALCPYCKAGSEVIKPKTPRENWDRLHGRA
jgi:hypothetical protein